MAVIDLSKFGKTLRFKESENRAIDSVKKKFNRSDNCSDRPPVAASAKDSFQPEVLLSDLLSPACGMTEEEKSAYLQRIRSKLMAGKKLTDEEMRFLQAECPELYLQAARVQSMRASFEQQLKNCKSKAEAANLFSHSMSMVGKEDPMKEAITAAYQDAYQEFQHTGKYASLPQNAKEKRENATNG